MKRIDSPNKALDLFGAGKHGFRDGNKALGINPTELTADFFNHVQEELANLVEGTGQALNPADRTQIRTAILAMISSAQKAVIISNAVFDASVIDSEVVYWDAANNRFDEAIADGTVKQNAIGIADVTNNKVYAFGDTPLFLALTPGAKYYLSGTVAGAITSVLPATNAVQVGIAKTTTDLQTDIDATGNVGPATETTLGTVEKATTTEAKNFTADKFIDGERLRDAFNATGNAPFFACRAWVNFQGNGTIRGSGNISSITRSAAGTYTANLATAVPTNLYAAPATCNYSGQGDMIGTDSFTTTSFLIRIRIIGGGLVDRDVSAAVII